MKGLAKLAVPVVLAVLASSAYPQAVTEHFTTGGEAGFYPVDDVTKQAQRFTSADSFNKLEVQVAEASSDSAFTLTLYRWRGNYADSTGATRQVVKQSVIEVSAPGWVAMDLPAQSPGVYLWEATAVPDREGVSLAGYDASTYPGGESYTNGASAKEMPRYEQGNHVPEDLSGGDNAQRFTATMPINEVQVFSPTWNDETGTKGYTLKLFKWQDDYETTVAGTPIATTQVTNFRDNAWVSFTFPTQPEGEYLWLASEPVKPPIGHWRATEDIYPDGEAYRNGFDTGGDFKMVLGYPLSGSDAHPDLASRTTTAVPLPTLTLLGPINEEIVSTNPATFRWEAVPGATTYTVEMSQTFNFDPAATLSGTSTSNSLTPAQPLAPGRWYWRVKAALPAGETDYSQATYQQTITPPAAGGELVVEDFEDISDWVMRALTFELSEEEKHAGNTSMRIDYGAVHGFAAADAPLGRLIPKNADGALPESLFLWVLAPEEIEGPIQVQLNLTNTEGQTSSTSFDLDLTGDNVGDWVKHTLDLTLELGGLPLNDPSRTLSVFSLTRPDALPAATIYVDDLGGVYPPSTAPPPGVKGDVDGNGQVAILDVVTALRIVAGLAAATPENLAGGDLNGNGRIEITEVVQILRAVAGLAPL